ncbi:unnamed protein product [Lactuca virosa]|uniref:Uncharacterized protein n=1 Tax=Lactuca virosa TaxID=75947 RepID=A0AAU9P1Y7_9ASTR|nr:unnamed protein product [Lactuca virosa]
MGFSVGSGRVSDGSNDSDDTGLRSKFRAMAPALWEVVQGQRQFFHSLIEPTFLLLLLSTRIEERVLADLQLFGICFLPLFRRLGEVREDREECKSRQTLRDMVGVHFEIRLFKANG